MVSLVGPVSKKRIPNTAIIRQISPMKPHEQ